MSPKRLRTALDKTNAKFLDTKRKRKIGLFLTTFALEK